MTYYLGIGKQTVLGTSVAPSPMWRSLDREWPRDEQGRYLITNERAEAQWLTWQTETRERICAIFGVSPELLTPTQREGIARLLSDIDERYSGED